MGLLPPAILVVLGSIAYWNSTDAPFVFDDLETIQRNTGVRFGDYFSNFSLAGFLSTRSLLFVTFAFNHWVGGQNVTGYHILNLAFHVLNGLLVFFTARNIFRRVRSDETTVRMYAMLAAAFFLVHPVQTESVTYVSSRSELLSTFFYLAGFAVFVFTPEQKIGFLTAISVLACLLLGFGGKETIVTLPLAILLFDFLFIAKGSFKAICTRWRFYLIFVIAAALSSYYLLAKQVVRLQATGQTLLPRYYFLTQQRVIARYLRLVVLPAGLNLDYDFTGSTSLISPGVLPAMLLILSLIFIGWKCRRASPVIAFSIFWFFIALSPTSSIIPIPDVIFEHRLYLPLAGACMAFPFLIEWIAAIAAGSRQKKALGITAVLLLIALTIGTVLRNEVWRDEVRLLSDVVAKSPHKQRPYNGLIYAYMRRGQVDRAIPVAKLGAENVPGAQASFLDTLGTLYVQSGQPVEAVGYFQKSYQEALRARASTEFIAFSLNNLGRAHLAVANSPQTGGAGRIAALRNARESFQRSLETNPGDIRPLDNLISASRALGEAAELEQDLRKKIAVKSDDFSSAYGLAALLSLEERYAESLPYFQKAEARNTFREIVFFNHAFALAKLNEIERAIDKYLQALRTDPTFSEARYNLALLYIQKRDYDSAVRELEDALKQDPQNSRFNLKVAEIYAYQGKVAMAKKNLQEVLRIDPQDAQALSLIQRIGRN